MLFNDPVSNHSHFAFFCFAGSEKVCHINPFLSILVSRCLLCRQRRKGMSYYPASKHSRFALFALQAEKRCVILSRFHAFAFRFSLTHSPSFPFSIHDIASLPAYIGALLPAYLAALLHAVCVYWGVAARSFFASQPHPLAQFFCLTHPLPSFPFFIHDIASLPAYIAHIPDTTGLSIWTGLADYP